MTLETGLLLKVNWPTTNYEESRENFLGKDRIEAAGVQRQCCSRANSTSLRSPMKFYCLVSDEPVGHAHPSLEADLRSHKATIIQYSVLVT